MTTRVAVIGAGIIGLATARELERQGFACLVFERGAPGGAQSAGESRIFRHAHDDPRQTWLAVKARLGWSEWEEEFGSELISGDGAVVIGHRGVERLRSYSRTTGAEVQPLGPGDLRELLPIMAYYEGPAMLDPAGGAIRSRLTLASLISAVGLNLVPEKVESISPRPDGGVTVATGFGLRDFDAAVVAAGAGTAALAITAGVRLPIESKAHVRLSVPLADPAGATRLACLQDSSGQFGEEAAYGSPIRGNREYAIGLSTSTPYAEGGQVDLESVTVRTRDYIERSMPGLELSRAVPFQRWITELPWSPDGLAVWQAGGSYFIAGHNLFKLAPLLGRVLADSVAEGRVPAGFRPEDRLGDPGMGLRQRPEAAR